MAFLRKAGLCVPADVPVRLYYDMAPERTKTMAGQPRQHRFCVDP